MARHTQADLHPTDCLDWSREPVTVRAAYDDWLAEHPAPAPRVVPAKTRTHRSTR
ncbi:MULTISPECIES: hypothetical protein [unclassified Microbispora]|uniref:hypothetical protein n=1 Tax=unclassified Microbispora TaxID=2614687 RepID=UPI00143A4D30|nr:MULTISPECIES: hypothetical protein [unclassified Microbispora]NJP24408.1 hypothetical protein [Microbispora sp. CL1-1]